jgi:hypothetical protein
MKKKKEEEGNDEKNTVHTLKKKKKKEERSFPSTRSILWANKLNRTTGNNSEKIKK